MNKVKAWLRRWLGILPVAPEVKFAHELADLPSYPRVDYELGAMDPVRITAFGGIDTRLYITDHPFDPELRSVYESWGLVQAISWTVGSSGFTNGTVVELNMNGNQPPELADKYLTVFSANEYGDAAVMAAFKVQLVTQVAASVSVDDLIVERSITWTGQHLPEICGPVNDT